MDIEEKGPRPKQNRFKHGKRAKWTRALPAKIEGAYRFPGKRLPFVLLGTKTADVSRSIRSRCSRSDWNGSRNHHRC